MRTLRECSKNNKIKNRYIITMAYKTRKINKRRNLQKRKSRRMNGGDPNAVIVEEKKVEEVPTLMSNLEDSGNLLMSETSNLAAKGIQSTAEAFGLDPNISVQDNINEMGDKMENISAALDSPEGEKLKAETGKLLADSLEVLEPSIKKAEDIAEKSIGKLAETGTSILVTAANELPPIFFINELSKLGTAAAEAGEAVAELTTTGTQAIESLEEQKRKASSLWERGTSFFNNISTNINKNVADRIASAQESVDKEGKQIIEANKPKVEIPQMTSDVATDGSLKKIQNEAKMIGGRARKSHLDFLAPHVNRSQILRQYGGKWQTKRRNKNRRYASRRH
jgi:uncharacterized protein YaaR (DUF327 family)